MRTLCAVAVCVFLLGPRSGSAEQQEEARTIVDKAIQAHGGAEKLAKMKAQGWKAKGKMTLGDQTMMYDCDYIFASPDKFRFDLQMEAGGKKILLTAATDGKAAWEQMVPMLRDMAKEKQEEFHHNVYVMYLLQLTPLKDKAFTLTSLGESKLGEQTLVGVKVTRPGRRDVSLYFDKKTGLLAKTSTRMFDEFSKKDVTQETFPTGYRDKDGRKVFDKLTIQRDGKELIVEEYSGQRILDKVDAKLFAKPAAEK
jgi:hypothetical protein